MKLPPIYFVSLGPGDPELMTMGCYHCLQQVDIIYCPSTANTEGVTNSKAAEIMIAAGIPQEKMKLLYVPMQRKREAALTAYEQCAQEIANLAQQGNSIAVAVEGDISIYASTQTIADHLTADGFEVEMVAGIPSFIAAAAALRHPLVMGGGSLLVSSDFDQIKQFLEHGLTEHGSSIVCMKIKSYEQELKAYLAAHSEYECFYYEFLCMGDREFTTTNKQEIIERSFPYFSSMIIYHPYNKDYNR